MKKINLLVCILINAYLFSEIKAQNQFNYAKAWKSQDNNTYETATCITEDNNGNIYIGGEFEGTVDFDPTFATNSFVSINNSIDAYISKFDASGNYLWTKTFGGTSNDYINKIKINSLNELLVLGYFSSTVDFDPSLATQTLTSAGSSDIFLAKFDLNGNYLDVKKIGGSGSEAASNLTLDQSGNIFICGKAAAGCDFDPGLAVNTPTFTHTGFMAKYTPTMGLLFVANNIGEYATNVQINSSNEIIVGGYFQGTVDFDNSPATYSVQSSGMRDVFICKYTSTGNFSWLYNVGSTSSDELSDLTIDNNFIYACGSFQNLIDFDNSAGTYTLQSNGQRDAFFIKLNHNGNLQTAFNFGGTLSDDATSITKNGSGFTIAIYTSGVIDCDPGPLTTTINTNYSATILEFNNSDAFISKQQVGEATPFIYPYQIIKNSQNQIYMVGILSNSAGTVIDFDDTPSVASFTCGGNDDAVLIKYGSIATNISDFSNKNELKLYPNPVNNQLYIYNRGEETNYYIYDSKLSIVQYGKINTGNNQLNLSGFNSGLYFLKTKNSETLKIIKE